MCWPKETTYISVMPILGGKRKQVPWDVPIFQCSKFWLQTLHYIRVVLLGLFAKTTGLILCLVFFLGSWASHKHFWAVSFPFCYYSIRITLAKLEELFLLILAKRYRSMFLETHKKNQWSALHFRKNIE